MKINTIKTSGLFKDISGADEVLMQGGDVIDGFIEVLNKKRFRVNNTSLSYRQINTLDNNSVIRDNRKRKKGWRAFSLKELIFFSIIKELRKYGIRDKQLTPLRDLLFSPDNAIRFDISLIKVFAGVKIFLTFDGDSNFYVYDIIGFKIDGGEAYKSFLNINLNGVVMSLMENLGIKTKIEYVDYFKMMSRTMKKVSPSPREQEIINIIQNKDYNNITIRKKDNEAYIVKGEKATKLEEKDLIEAIKNKNFTNIQIIKRDGNIVNAKIEDIYKV